MLQRLAIENYALIQSLELEFGKSLSMITGETGAGKSIILGALGLIIGQRADSSALWNKERKCIIEGTFDIQAYKLKSFFKDADLDYDEQTIIRREITPSGKSRAFINDTPVNLATLKQLSEQLINVHAQHQSLLLNDTGYQLSILDTLASNAKHLEKYQSNFAQYQKDKKELQELIAEKEDLQRDIDFVNFQLEELNNAQLEDPTEQEYLEQELSSLENSESIKKSLIQSVFLLEDQDMSVTQQLDEVQQLLQSNLSYLPQLEELDKRLSSLNLELKDLASTIRHLEEDTSMDESRGAEITTRLDTIYRLQSKHRVKTLEELLQIQEELRGRSSSVEGIEDRIIALEQSTAEQRSTLLKQAYTLSERRRKEIPKFEKKVAALLKQMGMPDSRIRIYQTKHRSEELRKTGIDDIEFLFSANKGVSETQLKKVASGGELSRLVLAIKSLIANSTALPTLIFDEVDTGISGEVAVKVGKIMQKLADNHQVICITHLPQIASKGVDHFFVYKENLKGKTVSNVRRLEEDQRIIEIAKMLSGEKPGEMAIANAKELLAVS